MPWCSESCSADSTIYFNQDRGEMGVDVSPSFQSSFTFRCRGVCSLSLFYSITFFISHTNTCTDTHMRAWSGGFRVEERLLWVTHSDKVLSRRAILIYVNKPCRCRERQRGHRWALVTSAPSLEGKDTDKEQCRHTHSESKREKRYWTVEKDTNTVAESDDKFSHTKSCFCGCKIKQPHAGNLQCGVCCLLFLCVR